MNLLEKYQSAYKYLLLVKEAIEDLEVPIKGQEYLDMAILEVSQECEALISVYEKKNDIAKDK